MMMPTIDELEVLTPDQLGRLLCIEASRDSLDFQYIQDLIAVGCPIDIGNQHGWTALHSAARKGHLRVVKFLISKGAEVNARDKNRCTPLHRANLNGDIKVVKFLLQRGADINARDIDGQAPWNYAIKAIREALPELEPK